MSIRGNTATTPWGVRQGKWYYGWNIVAVCILAQVAANGLTTNCFTLFLRDWSSELHASVSHLQLALALMVLISAFVAPWVGTLADRYSARWLFAIGLLGMGVFYFMISVATAPWQILALYGLFLPPVLTLSASVVANALVSRWFVRRLGLALGLTAFGIGLAGVLLPPVVSAILPIVGWRLIWRGGSLLTIVIIMPLVAWVIRNRPSDRDGSYYLSDDGNAAPNPHADTGAFDALSWREIASRKNFWLLVAIYLPIIALYVGCAQNLAPYVANHGLGQKTAGLLIAILSFSQIVSMLALGLLSDRFGNRLPFAGLALVMAVGATLFVVGTSLPDVALACALIGSGGGVFTLLAAAIAVEFGAEGVGRAFGMAMLFIPVMALAPFVMAKTQESTGSYTPAVLGMAVMVLIAGGLSLLLREGHAASHVTATS